MKRRHANSLFAFTLVELLVVCSLIGLLISLLIPSLAAARKITVEVRCKNNLRQQGIAIGAYRVDNRDYYPCTWNIERASPATYDVTDAANRAKFPWAVLLNDYAPAPIGTWTTWEGKSFTGLPANNLKNIYVCPLNRFGWCIFNSTGGLPASSPVGTNQYGGNYCVNPYIFTFKYAAGSDSSYAPQGQGPQFTDLYSPRLAYGPLPLQRETNVKNPSLLILTWDAPVPTGNTLSDYGSYTAQVVAASPGASNLCYLTRTLAGVPYHGSKDQDMIASIGDGSVKIFKHDDFTVASPTWSQYIADIYYNRQVGIASVYAPMAIP